jgi:hypothetical protein
VEASGSLGEHKHPQHWCTRYQLGGIHVFNLIINTAAAVVMRIGYAAEIIIN